MLYFVTYCTYCPFRMVFEKKMYLLIEMLKAHMENKSLRHPLLSFNGLILMKVMLRE